VSDPLKAPFIWFGGLFAPSEALAQRRESDAVCSRHIAERTLTGFVGSNGRLHLCLTPYGWPSRSLGGALGAPTTLLAGLDELRSGLRQVLGAVFGKVVSLAHEFEITQLIVKFVAVNVVDTITASDRAIGGFPYHDSSQFPNVRLSDLHPGALFATALVASANSYGSYGQSIVGILPLRKEHRNTSSLCGQLYQ
jgi:hypothetical protein